MAKNAQQHEDRPWGSFEVLSEFNVFGEDLKFGDVVIKKIIVKPGKRLSYQTHQHRREYWVIVQGEGVVTINDRVTQVLEGSVVFIDLNWRHRIQNTHASRELVFVEITTGYFDEHDIIRLEDDFKRS